MDIHIFYGNVDADVDVNDRDIVSSGEYLWAKDRLAYTIGEVCVTKGQNGYGCNGNGTVCPCNGSNRLWKGGWTMGSLGMGAEVMSLGIVLILSLPDQWGGDRKGFRIEGSHIIVYRARWYDFFGKRTQ